MPKKKLVSSEEYKRIPLVFNAKDQAKLPSSDLNCRHEAGTNTISLLDCCSSGDEGDEENEKEKVRKNDCPIVPLRTSLGLAPAKSKSALQDELSTSGPRNTSTVFQDDKQPLSTQHTSGPETDDRSGTAIQERSPSARTKPVSFVAIPPQDHVVDLSTDSPSPCPTLVMPNLDNLTAATATRKSEPKETQKMHAGAVVNKEKNSDSKAGAPSSSESTHTLTHTKACDIRVKCQKSTFPPATDTTASSHSSFVWAKVSGVFGKVAEAAGFSTKMPPSQSFTLADPPEQTMAEVAELLADRANRCWVCECHLELPPGQFCWYTKHAHPLLDEPSDDPAIKLIASVCSVCAEDILANDKDREENEGDDATDRCCLCLKAEDEYDGIFFECSECQRSICNVCVASCLGGGPDGSRIAQDLQHSDEPWECPVCQPPQVLFQKSEPPVASRTADQVLDELALVEAELKATREELENEEEKRREIMDEFRQGVDCDHDVEEEIQLWHDNLINHDKRLADTCAQLQDELQDYHGIDDLALVYKNMFGEDRVLASSAEGQEWVQSAERELRERDEQKKKDVTLDNDQSSIPEEEAYKDIEDLVLEENPDDIRGLIPERVGFSRGLKPTLKAIERALECENKELSELKIKPKPICEKEDEQIQKGSEIREIKSVRRKYPSRKCDGSATAQGEKSKQPIQKRQVGGLNSRVGSVSAASAVTTNLDISAQDDSHKSANSSAQDDSHKHADPSAQDDSHKSASSSAQDDSHKSASPSAQDDSHKSANPSAQDDSHKSANSSAQDDSHKSAKCNSAPNVARIKKRATVKHVRPLNWEGRNSLGLAEVNGDSNDKTIVIPQICRGSSFILQGSNVAIARALVDKLKSHQKQAVQFMWRNCFADFIKYDIPDPVSESSKPGGCILAHNMGLGKSLSAIALLQSVMLHGLIKRVLLVVPVNTVENWKNEFDKWIGHMKPPILVHNIGDGGDRRYQKIVIQEKWHKEGGVLMTSSQRLASLFRPDKRTGDQQSGDQIPNLLRIADLVVIDEAHQCLKNNRTRIWEALESIETHRRICLTGTPLQNNLKEYHSMVEYIRPGLLEPIREFEQTYIDPILQGMAKDCHPDIHKRSLALTKILHEKLDPFIHRKDAHELAKELPPMQQVVLHLRPSPLQTNLYRSFKRYEDQNDSKRSFFSVFAALKPIHNHPGCLLITGDQKPAGEACNEKNDDDFLDESEEPAMKWWESITGKITGDVEEGYKIVVLLHILVLAERCGDKVVVFSQCKKTLNFIEKVLEVPDWLSRTPSLAGLLEGLPPFGGWRKGRDFLRIDGEVSGSDRGAYVAEFDRNDNVRAFILSSMAGGVGINLIAANRVVLLDTHFNPAISEQAIFRTYRYGQTKPVYVYRLLTQGSMEEKVYARTVTKMGLASQVIDKKNINRFFSKKDLADLCQNLSWVQCDRCEKWRGLFGGDSLSDLPDKWYCEMNSDLKNNACAIPQREEQWYEAEIAMAAEPEGTTHAVFAPPEEPDALSLSRKEQRELEDKDEILKHLIKINVTGRKTTRMIAKRIFHDILVKSKDDTPQESAKSPGKSGAGSALKNKKSNASKSSSERSQSRRIIQLDVEDDECEPNDKPQEKTDEISGKSGSYVTKNQKRTGESKNSARSPSKKVILLDDEDDECTSPRKSTKRRAGAICTSEPNSNNEDRKPGECASVARPAKDPRRTPSNATPKAKLKTGEHSGTNDSVTPTHSEKSKTSERSNAGSSNKQWGASSKKSTSAARFLRRGASRLLENRHKKSSVLTTSATSSSGMKTKSDEGDSVKGDGMNSAGPFRSRRSARHSKKPDFFKPREPTSSAKSEENKSGNSSHPPNVENKKMKMGLSLNIFSRKNSKKRDLPDERIVDSPSPHQHSKAKRQRQELVVPREDYV